MEEPTRRLDTSDEPPEHPTRRLTESAPLLGPESPPQARCPECGGPLITTRVRLGTGDIVVERLDASARDLLIHQSSKAKGRSPLEARVCIDCGFARLYAAKLSQLME